MSRVVFYSSVVRVVEGLGHVEGQRWGEEVLASCDWLIVASLSFNTGEKVERRRIVGLELV